MASLRRKPLADVAVASVESEQPVNVGIDSSTPPAPTPAPEPVTPPSEANPSEALKHQLLALQNSEKLSRERDALLTAESYRKDWLAKNPLARKHYAALAGLHNEALGSGLADVSPSYFDFMNQRLAELHAQQPETIGAHLIQEIQQRGAQDAAAAREKQAAERAQQERRPGYIVSAPVSREVPSASGGRANGKITLTPMEKEAARISGVTETEYARQKLRYEGLKESGEYSDRR